MNKEFEYMEFGSYPQGVLGETEPIEWIVLDRKGKSKKKNSSILLLSKYALEYGTYHNDEYNVTWEKCYLRKWLNTEFYSQAFSSEEQERIVNSSISNNDNVLCGYANGYQPVLLAEGGEDTLDKVFLLSLDEVNRYLGFASYSTEFEERFLVSDCFPTKYVAECQAGFLNENGSCDWWLRTPGHSGRAVSVDWYFENSTPQSNGREYLWGGFIRPAIWIYEES